MSYICIYRVPKKLISVSAFFFVSVPYVKVCSCSYVMPGLELWCCGRKTTREICHFGISDIIPLNYWACMSMTCPLMVGSPVLSTEGLEADIGIAG